MINRLAGQPSTLESVSSSINMQVPAAFLDGADQPTNPLILSSFFIFYFFFWVCVSDNKNRIVRHKHVEESRWISKAKPNPTVHILWTFCLSNWG